MHCLHLQTTELHLKTRTIQKPFSNKLKTLKVWMTLELVNSICHRDKLAIKVKKNPSNFHLAISNTL